MVKKKTCVFISGNGSNLKNLIYNSRNNNFPISIDLVICNNKKAKGIIYAKKNSIPFLILNTKMRNFERFALKELKKYRIELICLAGFMRVISKEFIKNFKRKNY